MPSITIRDTVSGTTAHNEYAEAFKVFDSEFYDAWIFVPYSYADHSVYIKCAHGTDVETTEFELLKTHIMLTGCIPLYQCVTSDVIDQMGRDLITGRPSRIDMDNVHHNTTNTIPTAYQSKKSSDKEVETLKKELHEKELYIQKLETKNDELRNIIIKIRECILEGSEWDCRGEL